MAVSINLPRILQFAGLPERALETLLLLLGVLIVSVIGLAPEQSRTALGVELLVEAVAVTVVIGVLAVRGIILASSQGQPWTWSVSRTSLLVPGTLPFVVGAVSLLAGAGGGLYWTFAGIVGALACAVVNAWVLLVEIQR